MLRINVADDTCKDDEVFVHMIPLDTDKWEVVHAIQCLYPKANFISIEVVEV